MWVCLSLWRFWDLVAWVQLYLFVIELSMGRASVEHYRLLKRQCVFSHDELVCKMAGLPAGSLSPQQMKAVYKDLLTMVDTEKSARKRLHEKVLYFDIS